MKLRNAVVVAMLSFVAGAGGNVQPGPKVWWEAEKPLRTNFPAPKSEPGPGGDILSAGQWIGVQANWKETPFLEYEVETAQAGAYTFYARKFWKHGPFRWRFDDQAWQAVDNDPALLDDEYLYKFWGANWVQAGKVTLSAGRHRLRIEVTANTSPAFFDCFLLTTQPFFPMGQNKRGEPLPKPADGFQTFNNYDTLFAPSPIDLRGLNERVAGERGFIGVAGDHFVQAGQPIRFLAVCGSAEVAGMPREDLQTLARFLARKGVNLIRFHSPIIYKSGPNAGEIDDHALDNLFYLIEAMKREGIFTHISIYFPVWFRPGERFAGLKPDRVPFALNFFNRDFEAMEEGWFRALLTRPSPYSGKALRDEAAVMGVEILNEDSFFFWTFDYKNIPLEQMAILEGQFGAWLERKYGSFDKALATWQAPHKRDDAAAKRAGIVSLWDMFTGQPTRREQDTARFLAETQKNYFDRRYRFLRQELGFKGVICGSNWRTANTRIFGALDKWTQSGCDFYDHHGYYGGWGKTLPDGTTTYKSRCLSAWDGGLELPFLPATIANKPAMVSEYAWMGMNDCRAEMPLLVSALASQAGLDAITLFALASTPAWRSTTQHNWPVCTPSSLGLFPGKALVFRKGLVAETPGATITVNIPAMLDLAGNSFLDPSANDANRAGEGKDSSRSEVGVEYLAYGKVAVEFSDTAANAVRQPEPGLFHDAATGVLRSANGQIVWPYKRGIFTVCAPQTQGVSGSLSKAGRIELPDLTVDSPLAFGVVWAVAMDDQPLAQSGKILLQVMSQEQNHGFVAAGEPERKVLDHGQSPMEIKNLAGTVRFLRSDAAALKVTALDINGCPVGAHGTAARIELAPGTIYYLIEK